MPNLKLKAKVHKKRIRCLLSLDPKLVEDAKKWCLEHNHSFSQLIDSLLFKKFNNISGKQ